MEAPGFDFWLPLPGKAGIGQGWRYPRACSSQKLINPQVWRVSQEAGHGTWPGRPHAVVSPGCPWRFHRPGAGSVDEGCLAPEKFGCSRQSIRSSVRRSGYYAVRREWRNGLLAARTTPSPTAGSPRKWSRPTLLDRFATRCIA